MEFADQLAKLLLEQADQDILLPLKVQIDGAVSHAGSFGDLGNLGPVVAVLGEYFQGALENKVVFSFFFTCHMLTPVLEYS